VCCMRQRKPCRRLADMDMSRLCRQSPYHHTQCYSLLAGSDAVSTAASVLYLLTWCAGALVRQCGRCWRTTHTTCVCARERRRSAATRWSSEERTVTVVPPTPATRTTSQCLTVSSDRQTDRQTDRRTDASLVLVAACREVRCSLKVAHTRLPSVWFRS